MFEEYLGRNVKVGYIDGKQYKFARGRLEKIEGNFLRINGQLGTIVINIQTVQKCAEMKERFK